MTEIILYHFSKRKNSTKRPTGQGTTVPCLLKSNTTFQTPVFKLKLTLDSALQFNYLIKENDNEKDFTYNIAYIHECNRNTDFL